MKDVFSCYTFIYSSGSKTVGHFKIQKTASVKVKMVKCGERDIIENCISAFYKTARLRWTGLE
jgi:hypothetical protein